MVIVLGSELLHGSFSDFSRVRFNAYHSYMETVNRKKKDGASLLDCVFHAGD